MKREKSRVELQFDSMLAQKGLLSYIFDVSQMGPKDRGIAKSLLDYGLNGKRCLDIGPGTGRWLGFMQHHGASWLGAVDISAQSLERCASICGKTQKADLETESLDFEADTFDVVISIEVLEHLRSPDKFLREILRVARNGALVIMSLPNIASFISRIRLLVGLMPVAVAADPTHVAFYRQKDIVRLLARLGQRPKFIPTTMSLNPFNAKSRFSLPSTRILSGMDDSLVFSFEVTKEVDI